MQSLEHLGQILIMVSLKGFICILLYTARCLSLYLFQGKGVASIFQVASSADECLECIIGE